MNKIKNSLKNITPFGGLNFIFKALITKKLDAVINSCLGSRSFFNYLYSIDNQKIAWFTDINSD